MNLFLIGEHHGKKIAHAVKPPACRVGRDPASDLVLPSQTVSRHHATIEVEGQATRVRDLGSRNGTRVNGRSAALEPLPIRPGDRVEFGSIALRVTDREPIDTPLFADDSELSQSLVLAREDTGSADLRIAPEPKTWRLLIEAGGIPVHAASLEETFDRILELVDRAIPATRLLLLLKDDHGVPVQRAARTRGGRATGPLMLSQTMVSNVLLEGASLLTSDAMADARFRDHQSVVLQKIRSAMAVPLLHGAEILGVLYVDSEESAVAYEEQDLRVLTVLGQMLGTKIENARLDVIARERERLRTEIETARAIQRRLLPQGLPEVPGYEMMAWQESCEEVGGDLYDAGLLPDGRVQIVLGDVSGKGVGAALLMSSVLGTIRALRPLTPEPDRLVTQLDRHLLQTTETMHYATLFLGVLDPATGRLTYVNGGHPAAMLVHQDGSVEELGPTDVPVGLVDRPGAAFEWAERTFPAGATLVVVSDGVTEAARTFDSPYFGEEMLRSIVQGSAGIPACELCDRIRRALDEFLGDVPRADDATMLVVRRNA
jgi:serine phosphatase RsbU (regulator of sigma subunit)